MGGATKLSDVETLGNMQAISEDKATKLIQKWFYGKTYPCQLRVEILPTRGVETVGTYGTSNGTLFKPDIDIVDDANHDSTTAGYW